MTRAALLLSLAITACGGPGTPVEPEPDTPPPFAEAAFGAAPQLVNTHNGRVLANPKLRAIFFANDAATQASIEQFMTELSTSAYWDTASQEYGVGRPTVLPTIVTADAPPATDVALDTWLKSSLDGTHTDWGTLDEDVIYSVFLPPGFVMQTDFGPSCDAFGAYHDEAKAPGGKHLVYALMPRCDYPGFSLLDNLTMSTSHEWLEAATDPDVETVGAFGEVDADHAIWGFTPAAENGDFCEYIPEAYQPLVGSFLVQRTWSNASAAAGHDPCVPAMAHPYVGAAPQLTEDVMLTDGPNGPGPTKGVKIANGAMKTIDVVLFSDVPTDDWEIQVDDVAEMFGEPRELSFHLDKATGHNGDTLHLAITRTANGSFGGSEFVISTLIGGQVTSMWWGYAAN